MVGQSGHSGEALYNILPSALSKRDEAWQDAEKGGEMAGTIPVLAQRAVSEGCEGAGRPFFLLAEPPR